MTLHAAIRKALYDSGHEGPHDDVCVGAMVDAMPEVAAVLEAAVAWHGARSNTKFSMVEASASMVLIAAVDALLEAER